MSSQVYKHKKTGNLYRKLCNAIDVTNIRDGTNVVVYRTADFEYPAVYYVRETAEFNEKFELFNDKGEI